MKHSHAQTHATLTVSKRTFEEIKNKLVEADNGFRVVGGLIDMNGIALEKSKDDEKTVYVQNQ